MVILSSNNVGATAARRLTARCSGARTGRNLILDEAPSAHPPVLVSSKQAKAFLMTSSGSVPFSFSPNMVRNIVKLIGPGASLIIPSRYWSVGFLPTTTQVWSGLGPVRKWQLQNLVKFCKFPILHSVILKLQTGYPSSKMFNF